MKRLFEPKHIFCLPWTLTILGTHYRGKADFMALDWLTRVNIQPAMLGICVNKTHASCDAIMETGEFSINVPTVNMIEKADYVGLVSGKHVDKSEVFEVFYGELQAAPMIAECPLTIECRLSQTVTLPTHAFFIADILHLHTEEDILTDGKPDAGKMKPILLTMPDNNYWSIGAPVGKAWDVGKSLKQTQVKAP